MRIERDIVIICFVRDYFTYFYIDYKLTYIRDWRKITAANW